jgi:four helix bundle protein
MVLTFQRLDVYRCAIEFLTLCVPLLNGLPRGSSALADQLRRAAMSIPLNIAEAEGRTGGADKARTYAIARGSAMECAAILDVYKALGIIEESSYLRGIELLCRVVAMLTKLCR